ncbi:helix-turn-helix domain-containing protein [Flagellimonas sp. S174]|uniref:helix-turn-helix domain-containing protein n=1 Tax=Flagellimonas sp. S174 TaxID=3410790 RepID=UPI003BF4CA08
MFENNEDIVKFFRVLVQELKPYASQFGIALSYQTKVGSTSITRYNKASIHQEITHFLKHILKYLPQNEKLTVLFNRCIHNETCCLITVTNTGVDLHRIMEITASTKFKASAKSISINATEFNIEVPLLENEIQVIEDVLPKYNFAPYYAEIGKRLSAHFSLPNNLLSNSIRISKKENAFLQRINAILSTKLEDNTFTVAEFANRMAMSRSQLFRKTKVLTNMSPNQYILYFRLQAAKELLESKTIDLNVSDVCYSVGFMSKSHFTRSFRKQFGMLPSQVLSN